MTITLSASEMSSIVPAASAGPLGVYRIATGGDVDVNAPAANMEVYKPSLDQAKARNHSKTNTALIEKYRRSSQAFSTNKGHQQYNQVLSRFGKVLNRVAQNSAVLTGGKALTNKEIKQVGAVNRTDEALKNVSKQTMAGFNLDGLSADRKQKIVEKALENNEAIPKGLVAALPLRPHSRNYDALKPDVLQGVKTFAPKHEVYARVQADAQKQNYKQLKQENTVAVAPSVLKPIAKVASFAAPAVPMMRRAHKLMDLCA